MTGIELLFTRETVSEPATISLTISASFFCFPKLKEKNERIPATAMHLSFIVLPLPIAFVK